ncbi:MAG: DUF4290 domain-containing protein [Rikenellaceae bacterium]
MNKNYNYKRQKLILPEYGRHIQEMVDSLATIEDRSERNRQARAVIAVMGNLNPLLRDTANIAHKLWDHLFIMSDFKLDVDSPYPLPTREALKVTPRKLDYNQRTFGFKHYGRYAVQMIRSLKGEAGSVALSQTVENIARFMRSKSFEYNQEHPNNETIIKDIKHISNNEIELDEAAINNIRSDYRNNHLGHPQRAAQRGSNNTGSRVQRSQPYHQGGARPFQKSGTQRRNPNPNR